MTRIWLNHWFSTAYNIIELLRQGEEGNYWILGSNERPESPIQAVCDEWYQEPVLRGEAYVDFCLEFCRQHHVDVFLPRREMVNISRNLDRFDAAGVRVMVDAYDLVSVLNQKDQAYQAFRDAGIECVPEYEIVTTPAGFERACGELQAKYDRICFKFVRDEGGTTYRMIDDDNVGYAALFRQHVTHMTFADALAALREREVFAPLMVMPYLSGDEVSVDCLGTEQGLIAVPRVKGPSRVEHVRYDDGILEVCRRVLNRFPLEQPCNVQFKYRGEVPYLLEVNTRMSGGVQMSCAVSGINIPSIAVHKLLGVSLPWENRRREGSVTFIEKPLVLPTSEVHPALS